MYSFKGTMAFESTDSLLRYQAGLLRECIDYISGRSPFYKRLLSGLSSSDVSSIEDIRDLPITTKEDLQRDNWAFLCVPREGISEVVATTGTTGRPVFFALTERDLARLAENEKRAFEGMSVGRADIVQVAVTLDNLFIAGLAYYSGLKTLGAGIIRTGPQNPKRQLELLASLEAGVIIAVPSFMLHIGKEAEKAGISLSGLKVKKALLIGETIRSTNLSSNSLGAAVEKMWGVETFSTYGITEASTAFYECASHKGLHAHPDFVYAEILDDDGNPLPAGQPGELTVTTFQVEGMPLLRYRTGDVTFMLEGQCECGSNAQRLGPVVGRKSHRLKVKGTTVYPGAIENGLHAVDGVVNFQICASSDTEGSDMILVRVGSEDVSQGFVDRVRSSIRSYARVTPLVEVFAPSEVEALLLEGGRRKKMTFVDNRVFKG